MAKSYPGTCGYGKAIESGAELKRTDTPVAVRASLVDRLKGKITKDEEGESSHKIACPPKMCVLSSCDPNQSCGGPADAHRNRVKTVAQPPSIVPGGNMAQF